ATSRQQSDADPTSAGYAPRRDCEASRSLPLVGGTRRLATRTAGSDRRRPLEATGERIMQVKAPSVDTARYARTIEASRRVRWEIDGDVIRCRDFDHGRRFLPDGLSLANELEFLSEEDRRLLSQVQGRSYAYMFGLVERFIGAKVLEVSRDHWLGDQVALEALVRFSDEELKHQELFRRLEELAARGMPEGYVRTAEPNAVAAAVLSKSTWAVQGLTMDIELFTQAHYRSSISPEADLCPLWKDVFL